MLAINIIIVIIINVLKIWRRPVFSPFQVNGKPVRQKETKPDHVGRSSPLPGHETTWEEQRLLFGASFPLLKSCQRHPYGENAWNTPKSWDKD